MSCPQPGDVVAITSATAESLQGCDVPLGVTFRLHYDDEVPVDPIDAPPSAVHEAAPSSPSPAPPSDLREVPSDPPAAGLSALEEVPAVAPDLAQLEGLAGGNPLLLLALALLVVVGGPLGWRLWTKLSEQQHEQAMKRLELERDMAGLNGAQPPPCQATSTKLQKELDALEKRHAELSRRVSALLRPDGPNLEELDERVVRLEKAQRGASSSSRRS